MGCGVWLPRKGRHCGGSALPGSNYCGNHQPSQSRVPCPIDPSHTVLEHKIAAHLRKCPAAKLERDAKNRPYFSPGVNAGSDCDCEEEGKDSVESGSRRAAIESLPKDKFEELVMKIEVAHSSCFRSERGTGVSLLQESFATPSACAKWLCSNVDRRHPMQEKHISQQASMLGNLEEIGLLRRRNDEGFGDTDRGRNEECFIEFGAGRGYLSHMLSDCYAADNIILVERRSYKFKADRTLRYAAGVSLSRLRVDIEDLKLDAVDALQGCKKVVAVGKHLCGAATDMALRCCSQSSVVFGIGFATCCHHLCQWKAYVNKEFFQSMGLTKTDFEAVVWMTSWALSGNCDEKAELGMKCKELLDMGRLLWLQRTGMSTKMVKYISPQVSPENKFLMATKRSNELEVSSIV
ncbi:hypothetical protein SELMODRAFT_427800 [Selaginella moellendorffii]|uniref:tRNA:m(4)X modification enzyme TRM13 n=1 Tax=Selaginella moellendorffii TaxID=88036 RepID=D8T0R3_SELML|nr:tRNA:m(4)X modification enzyme TRM13 isoform X2 [Selaginella moellendorffii]EFJ09751.1 hypothetical protein SELMODRAFT_427800 [Selaginella moellendorffii]|eukprot:XP_002989157.1 tRNA:m(4)X modification enzyme TRM13 isoform X2 [Selaginella moellendorffii]